MRSALYFESTGVIRGEQFFDDKPILCEVIASMCLTACFAAFFTLGSITMARYLYVCHHELYVKVCNMMTLVITYTVYV